ncbi:MAG TPA: iron-containing alcohol dehydrogenase [Thermoplasmata archaeon]
MSGGIKKLETPGRTYFGAGASSKIVEVVDHYSAKKVFVVTDKGVRRAGLLDTLLGLLRETRAKIGVFDGTESEPTVKSVAAATEAIADAGGSDLIISLGGGSVMDVAKCANVVHMNGGSILDYEDGISNPKTARRILPHVAIPTTAGTGSEATVWAVFIDPKRKFKTGIQNPGLIANVAILDPEMTRTMPANVTAATGMDALTHAIEAYVSVYANPLTEAYCVRAISLAARSLRKAVKDGDDIGARSDMLLSSYMAGSAFSNSSLGIVHTLAEAMGGYYRIPHGMTNALMLPHVMEFNLKASTDKFAEIANLMGARTAGLGKRDAALLSVKAVSRLCDDVGLPRRLRDVGVMREDFRNLVDIADRWANLSGNPREISRSQIEHLYKKAY